MDQAPLGRDCVIASVGKQRNGKPRYWCTAHQASATGKFGRRLDRCEGAYRFAAQLGALEIEPSDFGGGIAIWGAVKPVYDTSGLPVDEGVHVHARREIDGPKDIDDTFPAVAIKVTSNLLDAPTALITVETAVASYISRFLNRSMMSLFCTYCGEPHLDSEWFAVKLHKRHLCHSCGRVFLVNEKCVSNPLERLRYMLGDRDDARVIEPAKEVLDIKQSDAPGGLQIWASNPAILWTAAKPENEGIHVHGYASDKITRIFDDTYRNVMIDGVSLDPLQLRYFMAQQALNYLDGKIISLKCECGMACFDEGEAAFNPHNDRRCKSCGKAIMTVSRRKKVVSNPFVDTIELLKRRAA